MRSKKLVLTDGMVEAPVDFLFVPLLVRRSEQDQPILNPHLVGLPTKIESPNLTIEERPFYHLAFS